MYTWFKTLMVQKGRSEKSVSLLCCPQTPSPYTLTATTVLILACLTRGMLHIWKLPSASNSSP